MVQNGTLVQWNNGCGRTKQYTHTVIDNGGRFTALANGAVVLLSVDIDDYDSLRLQLLIFFFFKQIKAHPVAGGSLGEGSRRRRRSPCSLFAKPDQSSSHPSRP